MSDSHAIDYTEVEQVEDLMTEDGGAAIIDFWSPTCGPCRTMHPIFEELAERYADAPIEFVRINTATSPELAAPFNVRSVPTFILVNRGEIQDVIVGRMPPQKLEKSVQWLMRKAEGKGLIARLFGR